MDISKLEPNDKTKVAMLELEIDRLTKVAYEFDAELTKSDSERRRLLAVIKTIDARLERGRVKSARRLIAETVNA